MTVLAGKKCVLSAWIIANGNLFLAALTCAQEQRSSVSPELNTTSSRREENGENSVENDMTAAQRWVSINEDYSVDKDGLTTRSRWLTLRSQLPNTTDIESYGGTLIAESGDEHFDGTAAGGTITLNGLHWLRRVDAALYRFNNTDQWEGGAQFLILNDQIEIQLQHNVFLWWRELSAKKFVLNSNIPFNGMNIDLNYQRYAVSDDNTVQDATIRFDFNELLRTQQPLHWRMAFHRRSATFNDPDYWSPSTAESTLELGGGLTWQKTRWQFSLSAQRNFALNNSTDPSWSIDSTIAAKLNEKLSISVVYASGNGYPQRDAFWWQFISAVLKSSF